MSDSTPPKSTLLTQANLTTALSLAAFILAAGAYMIPPLSALVVKQGLEPQVLEKAFARYETYQKAKADQMQKIALDKTQSFLTNNQSAVNLENSDPVIGNRKAPIRVFAFIDYNCSACRAVDPHVLSLIKQNPDAVLVIKQFPVITEISPLVAAYALASHEMGQYEKAHHALYKGRIRNEDDIIKVLTEAGLNADAIKKRAYTPAIRAKIKSTVELGEKLQLTGTPAYIIGQNLVPGGDVKALQTLISAQRATLKAQNKT